MGTTTPRCGKRKYRTKKAAERVIRRQPERLRPLVRVYWCGKHNHGCWHVTGQP
jgi:hypothetical protein